VSRQAEPIGPALRDPRVWFLGIFNFCMLGSSYAYSFSAPTIVQTLSGLSITGTGFVIAAMYLLAAAAMFGNGILSDRARDTFWYVIPGCLMMSAGFLAVALSSNPASRLLGCSCSSSVTCRCKDRFGPSQPAFLKAAPRQPASPS
jgi:ACS family tartrate transporter-like MFS transporter